MVFGFMYVLLLICLHTCLHTAWIAGKYTVGLGIADFDNMAITCMSDFDSAPTSALLIDVEMAGIVGKDASGKLCWDVDL